MDQDLQTALVALAVGLELPSPEGVLLDVDPEQLEAYDRRTHGLVMVVERVGWPGYELVGPDGTKAAWTIAMHSFGDPAAMHAWAKIVELAAHAGQTERHHVAHLMDRVRVLHGKPQVYATQFGWGDDGVLVAYPSVRLDTLDDRRASAGMKPLEEATGIVRAEAAAAGREPPADPAAHRARLDAFLQRTGWRSPA